MSLIGLPETFHWPPNVLNRCERQCPDRLTPFVCSPRCCLSISVDPCRRGGSAGSSRPIATPSNEHEAAEGHQDSKGEQPLWKLLRCSPHAVRHRFGCFVQCLGKSSGHGSDCVTDSPGDLIGRDNDARARAADLNKNTMAVIVPAEDILDVMSQLPPAK